MSRTGMAELWTTLVYHVVHSCDLIHAVWVWLATTCPPFWIYLKHVLSETPLLCSLEILLFLLGLAAFASSRVRYYYLFLSAATILLWQITTAVSLFCHACFLFPPSSDGLCPTAPSCSDPVPVPLPISVSFLGHLPPAASAR